MAKINSTIVAEDPLNRRYLIAVCALLGFMLITVLPYATYVLWAVSTARQVGTAGAEFAILALTLVLLPLWVLAALLATILSVKYLRKEKPRGLKRFVPLFAIGFSASILLASMYLIFTYR